MDCIIYIRWSSAIQARGSSLARQKELCTGHAQGKKWPIKDVIVDDGVSAYTGVNVTTGKLGRFLEDAEAGEWPDGIILLTERLDRISRQGFDETYSWIKRATSAGVSLATVDGDEFFERLRRPDMLQVMKILVKSELAQDESRNKSNKIATAWKVKRERLAAGEKLVATSRAPAWVRLEGTPPAFVLISERAAIVRRVFEETVAGHGKHTIARRLNQEGVATFGRASGWHASYIQKILSSPTVLGEMQPGRKPRGTAREAVGEPIPGYYPAVVDADLHARTMRAMAGRSRRVAGRGRRLVNIFSGIAKCGDCASRMTFRGKGEKVRADGERVNEDYLVCDSYQRGRGCGNGQHYHYGAWETAILNAILTKAMGDGHFASRREVLAIEVEQAETVRRRDAAERKATTALTLYVETSRDEAKSEWSRLLAEKDECDAALVVLRKRITAARGAVTPAEHQRRIEGMFDQMQDIDEDVRFEARSRVMDAVHELTASMAFKREPTRVEVMTKAGLSMAIDHVGGRGPDSEFWYKFDEGFLD
ncbi:recombinase family protein [Sphingomonas sp. CV7422]|uniref:recombinase family protein n=1 Tax=Sphingomonas sp. CV7422 TaxID=3018036 RepID=UPI0022FDE1D5|nr:recombinase family protein [Sphingomonas sp. CV7422]